MIGRPGRPGSRGDFSARRASLSGICSSRGVDHRMDDVTTDLVNRADVAPVNALAPRPPRSPGLSHSSTGHADAAVRDLDRAGQAVTNVEQGAPDSLDRGRAPLELERGAYGAMTEQPTKARQLDDQVVQQCFSDRGIGDPAMPMSEKGSTRRSTAGRRRACVFPPRPRWARLGRGARTGGADAITSPTKPKAQPRDCPDRGLRFAAVADRLPGRLDAAGDGFIGDDAAAPDPVLMISGHCRPAGLGSRSATAAKRACSRVRPARHPRLET